MALESPGQRITTAASPGDGERPSEADRVAVSIREVSVTYEHNGAPAVLAVDDVSLDVSAGEFLSIVGPSGCGKSTLLKVLAGLLAPTVGRVAVEGYAPGAGPRGQVGLVFQSPVLLPWRTLAENVALPLQVLHRAKKEHDGRVAELLELVGLHGFAHMYPHQLSGGMQQRAGIARALVYGASVLLMDEPFGALDALTREQLNLELQRIWSSQQKTVIFVTHSINEAVLLSDRIVVMSPRPGRFLDIVENPMDRMRSLDDISSPAFAEIAKRVRDMLGMSREEATSE